MTDHNNPAFERVRAGQTLIIAPPEQRLAPEEIRRAVVNANGLPTYLVDDVVPMFVSGILLCVIVVSSDLTPVTQQIATAAIVACCLLLFMVLVPLVRRTTARGLLARLDLSDIVEADLPNSEIETAAKEFRPQWGLQSNARAKHLAAVWGLASVGSLTLSGHRMRPGHGPCPGCSANGSTWCDATCPLLDPVDYR